MQETIPKEEVKEQPKDAVVDNKAPVTEAPQPTQEEINWRKFRHDRETERKQNEEYQKVAQQKAEEAEALKKALEAVINKPSRHDEEDKPEISEEERISKEVDRLLADREAKREAERAKKEASEIPSRLASTYADFADVCSPENLDYLEFHFKEIAVPYKTMPDSYNKWDLIYQAIKKHIPDAAKRKKYEELSKKNLNAPQSSSSPAVAVKATGNPHILTQEAKDANWKRMNERMRS